MDEVLNGRRGSGSFVSLAVDRIVPRSTSLSGKKEKFGRSMKLGCNAFMFDV